MGSIRTKKEEQRLVYLQREEEEEKNTMDIKMMEELEQENKDS